MTDLTEQWKKGQLKGFKWYYVKFKTGEINICWLTDWSNDELGTGGQYFDGIEEENILEVLAPVPSYEEWKALDESDKRNALSSIRFSIEAAILRELLKECKPYFEALVDKRLKLEYIPRVAKLLQQIDEVLK